MVPIPSPKNKGRVLENLATADVHLSEVKLAGLQASLDAIEVHGHRGFEESEGHCLLDRH